MAKKRGIIGATSLLMFISLLLSPFVPVALAEDSLLPAGTPDTLSGPAAGEPAAATPAASSPETNSLPGETEKSAARPKKEKKPKKKDKKEKSGADSAKAPSAEETTNKVNGEEPSLKPKIEEPAAKAKIEEIETKPARGKKKDQEKAASPGEKNEESNKAVSLDPARPFAAEAVKNYNQGVELQQQGFLNQAIQKYKAALDADDRIERAYCNLGLIYIAQRNFSKASDAFKKALNLKPNNPFSLNGMGSVFYSRGKLQEAMERWKKAVDVDANFFSAYFNMANAWKNEKDLDKALDNYVMTIKTSPNMADAYYEVGLILARQKHPAQAQTMLARALQLSPEGEFVAEAKKQLKDLESTMGKDENDGEVKMRVVAPPSPAYTKETTPEESAK